MINEKQEKILNIIKDFINKNGYAPSIRELCALSGLSSPSSVHAHLKNLSDAGYITYSKNKKRSIIYNDFTKSNNIPVLGVITAGIPVLAQENIEGYIPVSEDLSRGRTLFALKVKGDSMINAGIYDNDTVIISKQETVENGEIAAVLIDDSATLKRFYKNGNEIKLVAENEKYAPIICKDALVLGKAVALYRNI